MEELKALDRDALLARMALALPDIRDALGLSAEAVADRVGMERGHYLEIEGGDRKLKWDEYMSLLFLFWNNELARGVVDGKELFPDALKQAMRIQGSRD